MVERKIELRRRRARTQKMRKLKKKLAAAKDNREREHVLQKIHKISPWWHEGKPDSPKPAAPKPAAKPAAK